MIKSLLKFIFSFISCYNMINLLLPKASHFSRNKQLNFVIFFSSTNKSSLVMVLCKSNNEKEKVLYFLYFINFTIKCLIRLLEAFRRARKTEN